MPGALALCSFLAALSCGPSFQAIYEGDQRFEHCYALDDNANVSLQDKGVCWRDWMKNYTYGQTRDRVEYAAVRQRALARVPALPTDEAMMEAAPGQGVGKGIAAPAPTSAFAPPPQTMRESDAGTSAFSGAPTVVFVAPAPSQSAAPPVQAPPSSECQDDCSQAWQTCRGKPDNKPDNKPDAKTDACSKTYKACMRGCFK